VQLLPDKLILVPVGPGETRTIQDPGYRYRRAAWSPDGRSLLVSASASGRPVRMFLRNVSGGSPTPVTPEGVAAGRISRDGKLIVAAEIKTGRWMLYRVEGGDPRPVPNMPQGQDILGFDERSESVYTISGDRKMRIDRLELATGKRTFFKEITPSDPTGVASIASVQLTPDGRSYCYSFMRSLSRLYVIEGLH
jgi:hypothetical protein